MFLPAQLIKRNDFCTKQKNNNDNVYFFRPSKIFKVPQNISLNSQFFWHLLIMPIFSTNSQTNFL